MHGDFRRLVHPATPVRDVDLEATRAEREAIHERLRQQEVQRQALRDPPVADAGDDHVA